MKKDIIRFVYVLGVISAITAFGVAGVYQMTRTTIEQKDRLAFEAALKAIFPDAQSFEPVAAPPAGDPVAGRSWNAAGVGKAVGQGGVLGYLAVGEKQGYSSRIKVLVAAKPDCSIKEIRILFSAETPGLGERAKEIKSDRTLWQAVAESLGIREKKAANGPIAPAFQAQFAGKTLDQLVVVKGETKDKIQAITAATVTSRAVNEAVKTALDEIRKAVSTTTPVSETR